MGKESTKYLPLVQTDELRQKEAANSDKMIYGCETLQKETEMSVENI
jgi:hypothetical protein